MNDKQLLIAQAAAERDDVFVNIAETWIEEQSGKRKARGGGYMFDGEIETPAKMTLAAPTLAYFFEFEEWKTGTLFAEVFFDMNSGKPYLTDYYCNWDENNTLRKTRITK